MNLRKYIGLLLVVTVCEFTQAQSIEKILSTLTSSQQKADTLQYFGRKFHMRAKPDSAAWCYQQAIKFASQIPGSSTQMIQLYAMLSRTSYMKRLPQKALETIRQANPYLGNSSSKPTIENYFFLTAIYLRLLLKYDSALYYFHKAETLNNEYRPYNNWYIYDGIAELFLATNDFAKAEDYYLKAYQLTKKEGIRMDHGLMINRLGNLYSKTEDAEKFAHILNEHEQFTKDRKKDFQKDPIHSLLFITWGNKTLSEKVEFLKAVKKDQIKNGYIAAAALANHHIASLYDEDDQPEEALKYLYENRNFFIAQDALTDRYPNLKYIYELEIKTGKTSDAVLTANQLLELNTKLTDLSNKELAFDLEKKYETDKKIKEIELLNSKNKLTSVELLRQAELRQFLERENILKDTTIAQQAELAALSKNEKDLQFNELEKERQLGISLTRENDLNEKLIADNIKRKRIMVSGLVLLTIAGLIILFQYRRQLTKTKIINKQREDLVMLNQEIHHRVKNNLQVISSLLDLQAAATDDKKTAEKFQEGSQRVQSMAFIHQNLYQGEDPGTIDIQEYIKMLTDNLMQSYNNVSDKITLSTDIEAINLHSDTVIPLGLIINELVSNSLKYAFNDKKNGKINIVLKRINETLLLQVSDNGIGIPESEDVTTGPSFGYKIIKAFSQKLKALITINNKNGTDVQLLISKFRIV